jgi:hypothetical protein
VATFSDFGLFFAKALVPKALNLGLSLLLLRFFARANKYAFLASSQLS